MNIYNSTPILAFTFYLVFVASLYGQGEVNTLSLLSPLSIAGDYEIVAGAFGDPLVTDPAFLGDLLLTEDTEDPTSDACTETVNDLTGFIAFIDRGNCSFVNKAINAVAAGAVAVLICNNVPGEEPFVMGGDAPQITIPVAMASFEDCQIIRAELDNTVSVSLSYVPPPPCDPNCFVRTYPESTVWGNNGEGDFACGLSDWVAVGINTGLEIWQWNEGGISESAWGNLLPMPDSLGCNGSAVMEYALYEELGFQYNADLISPVIDLSGVDHPILHFTSANLPLNSPFIYELGPRSSALWTYSIDGGLTWQDTVLLKSENIWNSNLTELRDGVLKETFILHEAANMENVRIKFIGYGDFYYWIIDDVYITDEFYPEVKGDINRFSGAPNFKTPASQAGDIALMIDINNTGNVDFDECSYAVEILKDSIIIYSATSDNLGPIAANDTITNAVLSETWPMSTDLGAYSINYTVDASGAYPDTDPENNHQGNSFMISDSTFSKMRTEEEAGQQFMVGDPTIGSYITYANMYYILNGDTDTGPTSLNTGFSSNIYNSLGLTTLTGEVREWITDFNNDGIADLNRETRVIAQGQVLLNPANQIDLRNINIPLQPYESETGRFDVAGQYLAIIHVSPMTTPTSQNVRIAPLSSGVINQYIGNQDYYFEPANAALTQAGFNRGRASSLSDFNGTADNQNFRRLDPADGATLSWNIAMHIGVIETDLVSNTQGIDENDIEFDLSPNPAEGYFMIDLSLEEVSLTVHIQIVDLRGKVISNSDFTNVKDDTLRINTESISTGVYVVNVFTETGVRSERIFIQK